MSDSTAASWIDIIDSAVSKNDAKQQSGSTNAWSNELDWSVQTFYPDASVPPPPGSDLIGQNAITILENHMLADAVQQILNHDYESAERDLSLVLELNRESSDAKFLCNAAEKRKNVISFCHKVQAIPRSVCDVFAAGTSHIQILTRVMF